MRTFGQRPDTKPQAPIEQSEAFQRPEEFRMGVYVILEEFDDYILCKGMDPNATLNKHTPSAKKTIKVAKPSLLMKTRWDGETVELKVNGTLTEVTYEYTDIGVRTATATVDGEEISEVQRITPDYFVGDSINAVQVRKNVGVDGVGAAGTVRLTWMETNSTRCWATTLEE